MVPTYEYSAKTLHEAIKTTATKEAVLEDISYFGPDDTTLNIVAAYENGIIFITQKYYMTW